MPTIWVSVSVWKHYGSCLNLWRLWTVQLFQVQCDSCDELISEEEEFCPSCGEKLPEGIFEEREPSSLSTFCERAIREMGVNPILARDGYDSWTFHKGSSEVRIFVYENTYLFAVFSYQSVAKRKRWKRVLDYILSEDFSPHKLGIEGRQIYIVYRVLSDSTLRMHRKMRSLLIW